MQFITPDVVGREIHRRMSAVYGEHSIVNLLPTISSGNLNNNGFRVRADPQF